MKFKKSIALATAFIFMAGLAACGQENPGPPTALSLESRVITETSKYGSLNLELPQMKGIEGADAFNAAVTAEEERTRTELEEAAEQHRSAEEAGEMGWQGLSELYLGASWTELTSGSLHSILIRWENYMGGAHGYYWLQPLTVDTSGGSLLRLADLFRSAAGIDFVTEEIENRISLEPEAYAINALDVLQALKGNYAFFVNGDKLIIYFKTYDIAPYAAGEQFFEFEAGQLKDYLREEIYQTMQEATTADTDGFLEPPSGA